jgi:palmitoyltransferase
MDDGVYNLPPYHPDFEDREMQSVQDEEQALFGEQYEEEEDYAYSNGGKAHVRRGSEGYEVRSINREDLLRQYLEEINAPDRYVRYEPEPCSESDDSDDDVPLSAKKVRDNGVQV